MIHRLAPQPALENVRLDGSVCMVTGVTSGHGRAVAGWLARLGADVVLLGRSEPRCLDVQREIKRQSGRSPEILLCDLASRAAIDRAATLWLEQGRPLHLLVNNAGLVNLRRLETVDGVEMTFGVNYLAQFQLTLRLLPRLVQSAQSVPGAQVRVVNVSSDMHRIVRLKLDDLEHRRRYTLMGAYGRSKRAIVHFTVELARRLAECGVTANAVDPGPVESRIGQNNPGLAADLLTLVMRHGFPEADWAARTAVWLAAAPDLARSSGAYYKYGRQRPVEIDPSVGERLWQISARMTGVDWPQGSCQPGQWV